MAHRQSFQALFAACALALTSAACGSKDSEVKPAPAKKGVERDSAKNDKPTGTTYGESKGDRKTLTLTVAYDDAPAENAEVASALAGNHVEWAGNLVIEHSGTDDIVVPVTFKGCDGLVNAYYDPGEQSITLCYELAQVVADYEKTAFPDASAEDLAIYANADMAATLLHEAGHAVVDLLHLPIVGNEETNVDEFAAVFALFNENPLVAMSVGSIQEALLQLSTDENGNSTEDFRDEHPPSASRVGNVACLVYGSNPEQFSTYVPEHVTEDRAPRCIEDYPKRRDAWIQLTESGK